MKDVDVGRPSGSRKPERRERRGSGTARTEEQVHVRSLIDSGVFPEDWRNRLGRTTGVSLV